MRPPSIRSAVVPLLAIGYLCAAWLIDAMPGRWDMTEDRRFTLPDALKSELRKLPRQVTVRLFATATHPNFGFEFARYQRRLVEALEQLSNHSGGKVAFERLDPSLDPRASRMAAIDEVRMISDGDADPFYFGMAVECLDKKRSFEFLDPRRAQHLLNDLMQAILLVGRSELPKIGLLGGIFAGGEEAGALTDWTAIEQLCHGYELVFLDPDDEWNDIAVVISLQPSGDAPALDAKYEAFLARGGDVLVIADPFSVGIESAGDNRLSRMRSSRLPRFVEARGVRMDSERVIYDFLLQTTVTTPEGRRENPAVLSLGADDLLADHPITSGIDPIQFYLAGAIELTPTNEYSAEILARSSSQAVLATADTSLLLDPGRDETLLASLRRRDFGYPLLLALSSLKRPNEGQVLVASDLDWLHREVAGQRREDGSLQSQNANAALLMNAIDYLSGDNALRETRLRGLSRRSLSGWAEMRNSLTEPYRPRIGAAVQEIAGLEKELAAAEAGRNLSAASDNFQAGQKLSQLREELRIRRAELARIRSERNAAVRRAIDLIKWSNVALPPLLLFGAGWIVVGRRGRTTRKACP